MEQLELFNELCAVATAMESLARSIDDGPTREAIGALVLRLDGVIDRVVLEPQEEKCI